MFKSKDVAYMKPSSFCSMSDVLGNWYGFLFTTLFTSLKSAKDLKEPSGFAMVNMEHSHSELLIFLNTPYEHNLLISSLSFSLVNMAWGKAWHDMALDLDL